jgi:hypothetical protein
MESTTANIIALLEKLDDDIDDLDDSIAPILETSISDAASKLPILDKAKLYVLTTYAIESILFCTFPLVARAELPLLTLLFSILASEWYQSSRTPGVQRVDSL